MNPDENLVVREEGLDLVVDRAAARTVGVEGELVREFGLRAEKGDGDDAGIVEFDAVAGVLGEAVGLAEGVGAAKDALAVARKALVEDEAEVTRCRVVFGVLQSVVAEDVDGVAPHLLEDAQTAARADHEQAACAAERVEDAARLVRERGLVLGESAVEVEGDKFDSGRVHG